jgi:hypothetical protein
VASLTAYSLISNFTVALFAPLFFSFVGYNELPFFESVLKISKKVAVCSLLLLWRLCLSINFFRKPEKIRRFSGALLPWSLAL